MANIVSLLSQVFTPVQTQAAAPVAPNQQTLSAIIRL